MLHSVNFYFGAQDREAFFSPVTFLKNKSRQEPVGSNRS